MDTSAPITDWRPERGRHDKEGRQRALVDAATSVFAEHGFDAATTRAVAVRAGCSEGLIHRYFGGKEGLLLAVLHSRAAEKIVDFEALAQPTDDLQADIEGVLFDYLDSMWLSRDTMRVTVSQACIDPEVGRTVSTLFEQPRTVLTRALLAAHQTAGRVAADADIDVAAQMISGIGFSSGFVLQVAFGIDREIVRNQVKAAAAFIARGISHPASPANRTR